MSEQPGGAAVHEPEVREAVEEAPKPPAHEEYPCPPSPEEARTSPLALASLATGISAYFLFPIVGAIAAIVTGFLAHNEIRASHGRLTGAPFATAGLVLGWLQIGLVVLFAILASILAAAAPRFGAGVVGTP